ncbi:acetyl-CoA hydrolase/transferase C-terminal domain-containing protein [Yimella sp. NH-Cas1]|uniref:acetyl-CoA hydrolase/transferase C-terminal domain-containing protein n=1 Tax=Yimella sp. NH-Cas1 TaxID=2917726 RepID=UPI001EFA3819|nr:acetyl-CoA hydrolase/transferase C-terminal domain-containing protein [Yimella sp. NH-Cas1]MCG8654618.1 acetyl-CoA hydrolase [Yimella sp. NH-Cas1]
MKTVTTAQLRSRLSMLQGRARVVVSGNLATPWKAVEALDHAVPTYILNILNGGEGIPAREGVIAETCFVGAGQRHHPALSYVPCRLSMVPDATLAALRDRKDLRVWTEMFSDGVLDLEERGAMDHTTPIITSFVAGSQRLYDWLDGNRRVLMQRTERTNDPALIARQRGMVSINTALQVDLFGQANASRINGRIHSGFGGQTDFIVGAMHSPRRTLVHRAALLAPQGGRVDRRPRLADTTTSFQQSAIVTEQGIAFLLGNDEKQQATEIIEKAAHPDVRDELRSAAAEFGLDNPIY